MFRLSAELKCWMSVTAPVLAAATVNPVFLMRPVEIAR